MNDKPKRGRPSQACTERMTLLVTPDEAKAVHRLRGDVPLSTWLRRIVLDCPNVRDENTRLRDALADKLFKSQAQIAVTWSDQPASPPPDSDDLRLQGQRS